MITFHTPTVAFVIGVMIVYGDRKLSGPSVRRWYPTSAAPPLIGLVFANEHAGIEIFRDAMSTLNHADPLHHFPIPGTPSLLDRFKEEYARHGEFMLAPVVQRSNGQSHMDHRLGIVKQCIYFRKLCEIVDETDNDALAHVLPLLSAAPEA